MITDWAKGIYPWDRIPSCKACISQHAINLCDKKIHEDLIKEVSLLWADFKTRPEFHDNMVWFHELYEKELVALRIKYATLWS